MKKESNQIAPLLVGASIGIILSLASYFLLFQSHLQDNLSQTESSQEKKPLYWVAPMDANYKRDKPGKSPMGMDLTPVYAEENTPGNSQGTIRVSPDVINNLGVTTTLVTRSTLHHTIKTVGYVQYDEEQLTHIHPRVEGWIEKLYVKAAGDPVVKNQPLYDLYAPELVNAQEELLLAMKRKDDRLMKAAQERLQALQLSQSEIKNLIKTRKVKQRITFFSPQTGVIDNLQIREGFFVQPGTTMMSIGQLDQMWVEAEVFERQSLSVSKGLPVVMTLDYVPGKEWRGKVDYVYPALDKKTRTIKVRLRFENSNHELKPNMFAQVVISTLDKENLIRVPKGAVIRTGNTNRVVLALGDGRFKAINVKIGQINDHLIEILSGLEVGDRIVTSAQFLLDSESSKTSDFKRYSSDFSESKVDSDDSSSMNHDEMKMDNMGHQQMNMNGDTMDHEQMNMNGSTMNHEQMNGDTMDHEQMKSMSHQPMDNMPTPEQTDTEHQPEQNDQ